MFLTRSIRRKLVIGLGLVCLMLLFAGAAGVISFYSYAVIVDELHYSFNDEPRRLDLAIACDKLFEPLLRERSKDNKPPGELPSQPEVLPFLLDDSAWTERVEQVHSELMDFRRRVDRLSNSAEFPHLKSQMNWVLDRIRQIMEALEDRRASLETATDPSLVRSEMVKDAARIQALIELMPNPLRTTESSLRKAPAVFDYRKWIVFACLALVPIPLISLVRCGHFWFFVPIRKLHEAASRVANGEYTHRLKLRGKDEMVDLANVFNRMIERFQSDKAKLDREVEERSRQLLRNERLAGIGFLATGIAHEINNPLSAIAMAAESLMDRLKEAGDEFGSSASDHELLRTYLEMIQRQSFRCQQITTRVLDFSRNSSAPRQRHDLTKIVAEVLDMVGHMSRFGHHTILFDRSKPHMVDVNAPEIQQVIINLVANGLEAMDDPGTMKIGIGESFDEVVLTVEDTGCGMTPHVLANLYEPFFTEKQPGKKGTGLGLSITNRIIAEHQGRIEASSEGPGKGSTFRVHLPRNAGGTSRAA